MNTSTLHESRWTELLDSENASDILQFPASDGQLQCRVSEVNSIACQADQITYPSERMHKASIGQLEQLGNELAGRIGYLMEPLALVEIDRAADAVQLRSAPPAKADDGIRYFELTLSRESGLHMQRYHAARSAARVEIPSAMTREVLERLAGDCIAATDLVLP